MVVDIAIVKNRSESSEIERSKKDEKKLSWSVKLVSDANSDWCLWLKIFWRWKTGQQDKNVAAKVPICLEIKRKKEAWCEKKITEKD